MQATLIILLAVLGLAAGSFLNVVIWRVPRKASVVRPGSRCPTCEAPIRPSDNVPVVSWLRLRGRCRHCQASIPVRYPLVEIGCGVLFVAAGVRFGWSWELPAYLVGFAGLLASAVIDLTHGLVPDRVSVPLIPASLGLLGVAAVGEENPGAFGRALLGGLVLYGSVALIDLVSVKGLKTGDAKLAVSVGLLLGWLGWGEVALGGVLPLLVAAAARRRFTALLAAGTVLASLWGDAIFH